MREDPEDKVDLPESKTFALAGQYRPPNTFLVRRDGYIQLTTIL